MFIVPAGGGAGNVTLVGSWEQTTVSTSVNVSDIAGNGWLVLCSGNGAGGGLAVPAAPTLNGTPMTARITATSYYSDDGACSGIWATPIAAGTTSVNFYFYQPYGGYSNPTCALFKAHSVSPSASVHATSRADLTTTIAINSPISGCAFVAGATAKSGGGGYAIVLPSDAVSAYGYGADRNTGVSGSTTFVCNATRHINIAMSLPFNSEPIYP